MEFFIKTEPKKYEVYVYRYVPCFVETPFLTLTDFIHERIIDLGHHKMILSHFFSAQNDFCWTFSALSF